MRCQWHRLPPMLRTTNNYSRVAQLYTADKGKTGKHTAPDTRRSTAALKTDDRRQGKHNSGMMGVEVIMWLMVWMVSHGSYPNRRWSLVPEAKLVGCRASASASLALLCPARAGLVDPGLSVGLEEDPQAA